MHRNFIDLPALHAVIAAEIAASALPDALKPPLVRLLRQVLPSLPLGHRSVPTADEPAWAHRATAADVPLFRLGARGANDARIAIRAILIDVEVLVRASATPGHPHAATCIRRLRGIDHWGSLNWDMEGGLHPGVSQWGEPMDGSIAELAARVLAAGDNDNAPRFPARTLVHAGIEGTRATTLAEIRAIGKEAGNCLERVKDWSHSQVSSDEEIWALRRDGRLVGVLDRDRDGRVTQLCGACAAASARPWQVTANAPSTPFQPTRKRSRGGG